LDAEEYVEVVLSLVEQIPWGRVTSYGAIAAVVGGGPRQVGAVMARHGGPVPWWRVVRADGSLPPSHEHDARPHYLEEGTPMRGSGAVDMAAAFWEPRAVDDAGRSVENSAASVDEPV
jgi:alkylated DNA nucleotide flippase Atl1